VRRYLERLPRRDLVLFIVFYFIGLLVGQLIRSCA